MPLFPTDPMAWVGLGAIALTILILVATSWPKAYILGMSGIVVYALQFADCSLDADCAALQVFGVSFGLHELGLSTAALLDGAWWTPVTYAFLHADLFHLAGNLFILLTAGPALEESIGPRWFLSIYALGAVVAAASGVGLALVTTGIVGRETLMVGASGAIFAVLTAFAIRHPRARLPIPLLFIFWLPAMVVLLIYLVMNVGFALAQTNVAWYGHFAGFAVGLALARRAPAHGRLAHDPSFDPQAWSHLATTRRAREALEHLRTTKPGEEAVAIVWLDVFARESKCPACGKMLEREGMSLSCPEGHALAAPTS